MLYNKIHKISLLKNNRLIIAFVCLLLTAVIALSAFAPAFSVNAAAKITPRYQPSYSGDGSYAYYTTKNIYYNCGYGMPNCTCYAYGRVYEMLGSEPDLCRYDAGEWYEYNKTNKCYAYGQTPKIGAIACWQYGDTGHVAVVEAIVGNKIIMSQSAYGYLNFYLSVEDYNNPGESGWTFQGYIYPGEFTSTGFGGDLYRSVDYTGSINFRSGPGTDYSVIDTIDYHMGFVVTEKITRGGYTWGKTTYLGKTGYIALTSDVQLLISDGTSTEPTTAPTEPVSTPSETNEFYIIDSDTGVNFRSGAGVSNSIIGFIPYNAQIRITSKTNADGYSWGYTVYNGTSGWCVLDYSKQLFGAESSPEFIPYADSSTGILGDVDGDGEMTIKDSANIQLYLSNYLRLTQNSIDCSDVDRNGELNIKDASKIQLIMAHLETFA